MFMPLKNQANGNVGCEVIKSQPSFYKHSPPSISVGGLALLPSRLLWMFVLLEATPGSCNCLLWLRLAPEWCSSASHKVVTQLGNGFQGLENVVIATMEWKVRKLFSDLFHLVPTDTMISDLLDPGIDSESNLWTPDPWSVCSSAPQV